MEDRFNTIAGWALGAGIVALGSSLLVGELFKVHPVETGGYPVASAEPSGGGGGASKAIDWSTVDAAKGEDTFKQCVACHSIASGGANGTGPNLFGILGKPVGGVGGFAYSDALKGKGGSWTMEQMDAWLTNPKKFAPGTKMTYAGIPDPVKRGNVIAYLNTMGSNLPMPAGAAPAVAEAAEAAPADAAANAVAPAENAAAPAAQ